MKKLLSVVLVCIMFIPTVCIADRQMSQSGKEMADGAQEMLSLYVKMYDTGVNFDEDRANKLFEFILLYCTGNVMYYSESEYSNKETKNDLVKGYAGIAEYNCAKYQDYANGTTSLKEYVDGTIGMIRAIVTK